MSDQGSSSSQSVQSAAPSTAAPAAAAAATGKPTGTVNAKTTFNSMADLQKKYPQLYKMMMENDMMTFISAQNRSQDRIHQINQQAEHEN